MGTVETYFSIQPPERQMAFAAEWIIVTSARRLIKARRRSNPMKHLHLAALTACAFAALCVPASACTSRKTGFTEFMEFDDLTIGRNTMNHTKFSKCCTPVSQTVIDSNPLGINCYIGGLSLDTEQLTVQSAINSEIKLHTHNSGSASVNSTSGTNEGTQLKARLA
jgi:hypothetical protein